MTADPSGPVSELARAKINLTLHVTGRRPDGYHLLDSLVVFAETGDTVTAEPSRVLSLSLDGPFGDVLEVSADNLVLRAAIALQDVAKARIGHVPGAALLLTKRLPVASGIGGGSADAAATLRALNRLWVLGLSENDLETIALPLGADVPVCIGSRERMLRGIGDRLDPAPVLPALWMVLVNPMRGLETRAVFAARDPGATSPAPAVPDGFATPQALADWLRTATTNDLASAARSLMPEIEEIETALSDLPDVLHAGMSGSGATCFALLAGRDAAIAAARTLRKDHANWWIEPAPLSA
jgi:4-diphosphocytidyl-2-C-methyl-D-erythritol kinase